MADKKGKGKLKREPPRKKGMDAGNSRANVKDKNAVKEVLVIQDQGLFIHATGDSYEGFFEAKKKDRSVKMHGPGTYKTAEGDSYTGLWDYDKLGVAEDVEIKYADGARYDGQLKDWMYFGNGAYEYPDGTVIVGEFVENAPINSLTLTDPNGHVWLGTADVGYCWFEPVNHFYKFLEKQKRPRPLQEILPSIPMSKGKAPAKVKK